MTSNLPTAKEVEQAVENVHIAIRWFNYLKKAWKGMNKKITALLLAVSFATTACSTAKILGGLAVAGGVVKILGSGKLPEPPDGLGAIPTPTPLVTAVPSAEPTQPQPTATAAPAATQTPVPTAIPTAAPAPVPTAEASPNFAQACMLDGPPWLKPMPSSEAIPVEKIGQCPRGFRAIDYVDSGRSRHGCMVDWACAPGTNGRSPWTGTAASVPRHVRFDDQGFVRDLDNGSPCGIDALGRKECNGVLMPSMWEGREEKPWVNPAAACDPPRCHQEATPIPPPQPDDSSSNLCRLPIANGDGVDCPRTSPKYLDTIMVVYGRILAAHPNWFTDASGGIVKEGHENDFRFAVVSEVRKAGYCAFFDGEEVALKRAQDFSEQYHVLSSSNNVRRGEGAYRATCSPAWSAIPPSPTSGSAPPLLVLWRAGNKCTNSKDTGKYINQHICIVDSTPWFRDPEHPEDREHDAPCDRQPALSTFCGGKTWGDARGPWRSVTGAEDAVPDPDNPFLTRVVFFPGQPFLFCVRPHPDVNFEGTPIPVHGNAEQCNTVMP